MEDVAGLIDDILSDYDWYDYADQLEIGEKSHYEYYNKKFANGGK